MPLLNVQQRPRGPLPLDDVIDDAIEDSVERLLNVQLSTDPLQELLTPVQLPRVIGANGQVDMTVTSSEEAIVVGHHAIAT